jgi:hypothetical protein
VNSRKEEVSVYLFIETPGYLPDIPISSFQLMVGAGALLIAAALLLGLRRTRSVAVQRSLLTDEFMIYLGRIADALERAAPPNKEMIIAEIERRMGERGEMRSNGKVHKMPLLGREFPEKK